MNYLYKKIQFSFKWLTLESIGYQIILLIHQINLFRVSGFRLYGKIGTIFSIIYLTVTIISFGLETSLSPFFIQIIQNKKRFKSFFVHQLSISGLMALTTLLCFFILKKTLVLSWSVPFIITIILLILFESIKKIIRGILYLAFQNKINIAVEFLYILSYVAMIWIIYIKTNTISLPIIFIPLLISSAVSISILLFFIYNFYKTLPDLCENYNNIPNKRIIQYRTLNFINQLTHNMFSSNFLVPFFAMQFGLEMAGVFKLLSHITFSLTTLMRKIFGWASDTILAHTKHLTHKQKQQAFSTIQQKLITVLIGIGIFFAFNLGKIITYSHCSNVLLNWPLMILFIVITLSENLFIPYEKFYIAEEKIQHIFFFNLFSIFTLLAIISYCSHFSQITIMSIIALTRIILFVLLSIFSFYIWNIKPRIPIKPIHLAGYSTLAFVISLFL